MEKKKKKKKKKPRDKVLEKLWIFLGAGSKNEKSKKTYIYGKKDSSGLLDADWIRFVVQDIRRTPIFLVRFSWFCNGHKSTPPPSLSSLSLPSSPLSSLSQSLPLLLP